MPRTEEYKEWLENDKFWKYGQFYFNPSDKRVFPPKREPNTGWTINFANTLSVIVNGILLAGIIYSIILLI